MLNDFFAEAAQSVSLLGETETFARASCNYSVVDGLPLAMAYVPMQKFTNVSTPEAGLCNGTIFNDLVLPFKGWEGGTRR